METQAGLLHLQEPCVQRICWITEDTLEFLAFKHIDVDCTGPNEKQQRDVVAQIVICTSVTGSVTALCVKQSLETKQEHQELGTRIQDAPSFLGGDFFCPVWLQTAWGYNFCFLAVECPRFRRRQVKWQTCFGRLAWCIFLGILRNGSNPLHGQKLAKHCTIS